jgi:acyl-coenzyme A synthetase/AMP-(fatty) acid ligase
MSGDRPPPTTTQAIARFAGETPNAVAVIEGGVSFSYGTMAVHIITAVQTLTAAGVRYGTIVGIECELRYIHLVLMLACEAIGATHVSMSMAELTGGGELTTHCGLLCVMTPDLTARPNQTILLINQMQLGRLTEGGIAGEEFRLLEAEYPADTVVRIARTSGTTGRARFMGMTRRVVESIIWAGEFVLGDRVRYYNFICPYGLPVITTYREANLTLRHGRSVVFTSADAFLPDLERFSPCQTFLLVSDAVRTAENVRERQAPVDNCLLRLTGAAIPPSLRADLMAHLSTGIISQYSMNESITIANVDENNTGLLMPDVEIRIVDETDRDVARGKAGTILVRSPRNCDGYLWDEALSAERFVDGWFRSSDMGFMPEPRKLIVIGRVDAVLNIGGIKFHPSPIEERIRELAGVRDAVLISLAGDDGIGAPHIALEREETGDGTGGLEAAIANILAGYVQHFELHFLDPLPRMPSGKVRRDDVRQAIRELIGRGDH